MTRTDQTEPHYLVLGKIERPHGVRGEIRMRIMTDYPERLRDLKQVYLGTDPHKEEARLYTIDTLRFHQGNALLRFKETTDRNDADLLRGLLVMIDLANAVPLEDDEFYLYQIIGATVITDEGQTLGTVKDVIETGANDVYVLKSPDYGELLIPVHDETLLDVDVDARQITVRLPEGLLPGEADEA